MRRFMIEVIGTAIHTFDIIVIREWIIATRTSANVVITLSVVITEIWIIIVGLNRVVNGILELL